MERPEVAKRVDYIKSRLAEDDEPFLSVRSDGRVVLAEGESIDRLSGQQMFESVGRTLDVFDLTAPLDVSELKNKSWESQLATQKPLELSGQQAFVVLTAALNVFEVSAPCDVAEFRSSPKLWGPNLVNPSEMTAISPWIMGGDPCINKTRIPTVGLFTLHHDRGLTEDAIANLYEIEREAVSDALVLERRLHGVKAAA
jgi:uncharacterized protein (DUF433 family)